MQVLLLVAAIVLGVATAVGGSVVLLSLLLRFMSRAR